MNNLLTNLVIAAFLSLSTGVCGQDSGPAMADRDQIVGTYKFVAIETRDDNGNWQVTDSSRAGYITYSESGYMGVHLMPQDRDQFSSEQPTPEEAQEAIRAYAAYFGPFTVHADDHFVIHHRAGQINPGGAVDAKRFYEFRDNSLILTPPPASGIKEDATMQLVWARLPDAELSAEAEKFVGFRQLLYTDRYTERDGAFTSHGQRNESDTGSYIIYTPTGHMLAYLIDKEGREAYAGATPTPEEALAAYRTSYGYFGPFTVYENAKPPYVVHEREGSINPVAPTDAERLYQFDGDILRLGVRPQRVNGEASGGHLYWQELPILR